MSHALLSATAPILLRRRFACKEHVLHILDADKPTLLDENLPAEPADFLEIRTAAIRAIPVQPKLVEV